MKNCKKVIALFLAVALVLTANVGWSNIKLAQAASKMKLSSKKLTLQVGMTKKLKVKKAKKKLLKKAKWKSSKKKVATVSKKGVVTAVAPGTATISVKVGKKKLKCKVTVVAAGDAQKPGVTRAPGSATDNPEGGSDTDSTPEPGGDVADRTPEPGPGGDVTKPTAKPTATPAPTQKPASYNGKVDFNLAEGITVDVYYTQDYTVANEKGVTTAKPRNSETGEIDQSGDGQVNFKVNAPEGVDITVAVVAGKDYYKNLKDLSDTAGKGFYRLTKIKGEVTIAVAMGGEVTLTADKASGTYPSEFSLKLSSETAGATIYYTLDGSDPSDASNTARKTYTSSGVSITSRKGDANVLAAVNPNDLQTQSSGGYSIPTADKVDKCTVLRAVAVDENGIKSDVQTYTYFVGNMKDHVQGIANSVQTSGQNLSIISITMDYDDLFDYNRGIYSKGVNYINGVERSGNFIMKGKEWERACHIDYFESDGTNTTLQLQQDCGIRIQGNYSRLSLQKSFRLYARQDYGEKNFKYPFFDNLTNAKGTQMDKFKTLVLRNGGNDWQNYKYKDAILQSFIQDSPNETLASRPCVVYLDGEYWGFYILQDDVSAAFLQEKRGVNKDNVVAYKGQDLYTDEYGVLQDYKLEEGDLPAGEERNLDYYLEDTMNFLNNNNLSNDDAYAEFIDKYVSEESAIDYYGTMLYLHNRYDWPGKNWTIWRTTDNDRDNVAYEDGRWRFMYYDLDLTTNTTWCGSGLDGNSYMTDEVEKLQKGNNVLQKFFGNMMKNETFRTKLVAKIKSLANDVFTTSKVQEASTKFSGMYQPLANQFASRFGLYVGGSCYEGNQKWLDQRLTYVNQLCSNIEGNSGGGSQESDIETINRNDGVLEWRGVWERNGLNNTVTAKTAGIETIDEPANFLQVTVDRDIWMSFAKPAIRIKMDTGYDSNARCHIWSDGATGKYFYLSQVEGNHSSDGMVYDWANNPVALSDAGVNISQFCINVNTGQGKIIGFEIFDAAN